MTTIMYNGTELLIQEATVPLWKTGTMMTWIWFVAYGVVFLLGVVGNLFVVLAVIVHPSMRTITNYFITNLAVADLLIMIICLPATLMNNVLNEWHFGTIFCKFSIWGNAMMTGVSVFTLVAVTADRYTAICHTMKYSTLRTRYAYYIIAPIWIFSSVIFLPVFLYSEEIAYPIIGPDEEPMPRYPALRKAGLDPVLYPEVLENQSLSICTTEMPQLWTQLNFVVVNIVIAYLIPLIFITVFYIYIFVAVYHHARLQLAVDHKAAEREQRMKLRITVMMLTVIIIFALTWLPLYLLYTYILFMWNSESSFGDIVLNYMRPLFQWLSMLNSCVNPILYAFFSLKFRQAFTKICLLPCMRRYARARSFTRSRLFSQTAGTGHTKCSTNSGSVHTPSSASRVTNGQHSLKLDKNGVYSQRASVTSNTLLYRQLRAPGARLSLAVEMSHDRPKVPISVLRKKTSELQLRTTANLDQCLSPTMARLHQSNGIKVKGRSPPSSMRKLLEDVDEPSNVVVVKGSEATARLIADLDPVVDQEKPTATTYLSTEDISIIAKAIEAAENCGSSTAGEEDEEGVVQVTELSALITRQESSVESTTTSIVIGNSGTLVQFNTTV